EMADRPGQARVLFVARHERLAHGEKDVEGSVGNRADHSENRDCDDHLEEREAALPGTAIRADLPLHAPSVAGPTSHCAQPRAAGRSARGSRKDAPVARANPPARTRSPEP